MDVTKLSDAELEKLRMKVATEQKDRRLVEDAPERANVLALEVAKATKTTEGSPWVQPTGAHNAYPSGWTATHNEKFWINTTPANVWEPGVSGWREITEDGAPAEFIQPTGAHDAYSMNERVMYEGVVWISTTDGNVWTPDVYESGWVRENPPVDPEPEEPAYPDESEPTEPDVPAFAQPTGGHNAYSIGELVLFEGQVWRSTMDGNVWSPAGYPQGWKIV